MTFPSDRDSGVSDANPASRLAAISLWVAAAAIVCVAATWPRWHDTPRSSVSSSIGGNTGNTGSINGVPVSATAPGQSSATAAESAPVATKMAPNSTSAGAMGVAASGTAAAITPHPATPSPSHTGEVAVPASVEDWQHLNDRQHVALAPFVDEWARLPDSQKRKWLAIAAVYPRMSPDEQQRLHARMLRWVQMTPEERTIARENYQMSRVLPPSARQQAWRAYEALSPAQKAKLAAAERIRRRKLVVSALPGSRAPLLSHMSDKNAAAGGTSTLSTEKLVPLGTGGNSGTGATVGSPGNVGGPGVTAPAGASLPDSHGTPPGTPSAIAPKGAKGTIGNLNLDNQDRP